VKVAILTDVLGGGTGTHILSMVRHWDPGRWEASIFTTSRYRDRIVPSVPVRYLPPPEHFRFYPAAQLQMLFRMKKIVEEYGPDVLHTYFFWSILYGRILKMTGKVKALVENREDEGFNWGRHEYFWLRATNRLPDRIICVSEAVKRVVVERELVEPSRVVVVHNGIEIHDGASVDREATRRKLGFGADHLVIGMVANYNRPIKGVGNFLEAIPPIVEAMPSARFLFVGGGEEGNSLRDKARSLGIDPYVVFAGFQKDIRSCYEIMDLSVLASFSEGLSMTLLESMAYGIPVVAPRAGGNPEVVQDGVNGYLVPIRDKQALVDRIIELLRNREQREKMGREGRSIAEGMFRMSTAAQRYLEIYERIAGVVA
jgi:glycosyltransferase involved in cell wall biosynthesis